MTIEHIVYCMYSACALQIVHCECVKYTPQKKGAFIDPRTAI